MKKIFSGLLNVMAGISLVLTMLGAIYLGLPAEFQEKIPLEINNVLILIFGNGGLGIIIVISKHLVSKAKQDADLEFDNLKTIILDILDIQKKDKQDNINRDAAITAKLNELNDTLKKNNKLSEVDLKIKKTNPLLKAELKEKIDEVLGD